MAIVPGAKVALPVGAGRGRFWFDNLRLGLSIYVLTSLVPLLGVAFGKQLVRPSVYAASKQGDLLNAFAHWDGEWYQRIALHGYDNDAASRASIAFFPAFPLAGRLVAQATGLRTDAALLLVAHLCLAATFVLLAAYVRQRSGAHGHVGFVLVALGLWPTTCFFRFAYSESKFLLCTLLCLYAMERRWPMFAVALLVGLTTATRSVGVGLLLPFAGYVWNYSAGRTAAELATAQPQPNSLSRCLDVICFGALACWGLAAFMAYQWGAFDDPLAFAHIQAHWSERPAMPLGERVIALVTLEPFSSLFDPASPCCWQRTADALHPLFSLRLANPIYLLLGLGLLVLGWRQRWLNRKEIVLVLCLLAIPYATRGYEMCLVSMGRFTAVAFPLYLVLGRCLGSIPAPVAAACCALSGFFLGCYAALFAAWYSII